MTTKLGKKAPDTHTVLTKYAPRGMFSLQDRNPMSALGHALPVRLVSASRDVRPESRHQVPAQYLQRCNKRRQLTLEPDVAARDAIRTPPVAAKVSLLSLMATPSPHPKGEKVGSQAIRL